MTSPRLAVFTFGLFRKPAEDPANRGFHDRNDGTLAAAEGSDGFIARSGYDGDPGPASWGAQVFPRFYEARGDGWTPATLSLWQDLESIVAFAYDGTHAEALRHGRAWFQDGDWPPYVAWWVAGDRRPDWADAVARHERLHDQGPGPAAFDFAKPFTAAGEAAKIDRARVKAKAARNRRATANPADPAATDTRDP